MSTSSTLSQSVNRMALKVKEISDFGLGYGYWFTGAVKHVERLR